MNGRHPKRRPFRTRAELPKAGKWATAVINGEAVRVRVIELVSRRRVVVWLPGPRQRVELRTEEVW